MAILWVHSSNSPVLQGLHTGLRNARESMNFPYTCMRLSGLIPVTSLNSWDDRSIVVYTFGCCWVPLLEIDEPIAPLLGTRMVVTLAMMVISPGGISN